jgi:hypothetical protein
MNRKMIGEAIFVNGTGYMLWFRLESICHLQLLVGFVVQFSGYNL